MQGAIMRELHELIRSLNPNQKRRFTQYCHISKPNSNSLVLFRILSKMKQYNREKIGEELRKKGRTKTANNLHTEMSLLYKIVLRILLFISKEPIENKLRRQFQEIVLLESMDHFAKSKSIMKTLKLDANRHNQDTLLIDIERYEQEKLEAIREQNENYSNVFVIGFSQQLDTNNLAVLDQLVPVLLVESKKYKDIETDRKLAFWYNLVAYYFRKQDFDAVLDWIEKITDTSSKDTDKAILSNCKLFTLLVHFELKAGATLLQSLMKKVKRGYKDVEGAKLFLSAISLVINAHYRNTLDKEVYQKALQKLEKTNTALPYYAIEIWLKIKIG